MKNLILILSILIAAEFQLSAQCTGFAACNDFVTISLGDTPESNKFSIGVFEDSYDGCKDLFDYKIKLEDLDMNLIQDFEDSLTIDCSMAGETYLFSVQIDGGNTCWGNVYVDDPDLNCVMLEPDEIPVHFIYGNTSYSLDGLDVTLNGTSIPKIYSTLFYFNEADPIVGANQLGFDETNIDIENLDGVTTLDLVYGQLLFFKDTIYPAQAIVMDVNNSGGINTQDLITLREVVLNIPGGFNSQFAFIQNEYPFPSDFNVFDFSFDPLNFDFQSDAVQNLNFDFRYYKLGDISSTDSLMTNQAEIRENTLLHYSDQPLESGVPQMIEFSMENIQEFIGLQLNLNFKNAEINSLSSSYTGDELLAYQENLNSINLSFLEMSGADKMSFSLSITPQESGMLSDILSIGDRIENEIVFKGLSYSSIELNALQTSLNPGSGTAEFQVFPNPSHGQLNILSSFSDYSYQILDIQGRVLFTGFGQDLTSLDIPAFARQSIIFVKVFNEEGSVLQKIVVQ